MFLIALFAILAAIANAVYNAAGKYVFASGKIGIIAATFLMLALMEVIALPIIIIFRVRWEVSALPYVALVAVITLIGYLLVMAAFSLEDASTVGPVSGLKVVYLAIIEGLLGKDSLGLGVALGAVLSVIGIAFISQQDTWTLRLNRLLRPGIGLMAFGALCFALADIIIKHVLQLWHGNGWAVNLYLVAMSSALAGIMLPVMARIRCVGTLQLCTGDLHWPALKPAAVPLAVSSLAIFLTQYFIFTSFALGNQITLTNILFNTRGLFIVLLMAALVLGKGSKVERAGWHIYLYRGTGAVLMLGAVALALLVK